MVKELKSLQMEIFIKDFMSMESLLALESTIGTMVLILKVIFKVDFDKDMEFGKEPKEIVINMKEAIHMTANMGMESLHGRLEMFIRETISRISEMGMERCIGVMEHGIKVSGKKEYNTVRDKFMFLQRVQEKDSLKKTEWFKYGNRKELKCQKQSIVKTLHSISILER